MRKMLAIVTLSALALACSSSDPVSEGLTTNTRSTDIVGEVEQIAFLERYVSLPSDVDETEFHIVYEDNSSGRVPGPSDWSIEYAVRIDAVDIDRWTEDLTPIDTPANWDEQLIDAWNVADASPDFYAGAGLTRAVYDDSVILHVSRTM